MKQLLLILVFFFAISCKDSNPITDVLYSNKSDKIQKVAANVNEFEVQVLFTKIERAKNGTVTFIDYDFNVNDSVYFYPASTVKFPIAVLALEKLEEIKVLTKNTKFRVEKDTITATVKRDVIDVFAVSSNEANNRLFEFLGKDEIHDRLQNKGITSRISHRLSVPNSDKLETKPLIFQLGKDSILVIESRKSKSLKSLRLKKISKGIGYIKNDTLINNPKDFSYKNYLPLTSLHNMMKRLVFPENFTLNQRFKLSEKNREFLLKSMKILPKEAGYNTQEYYDSYVKFLIFGDTKNNIPKTIKIYNKVGYAYGYLTDCAYIKDIKNNKEFIITATIHVNKNKIYNDNKYEYETVGIPFLAELGRELIKK